jgi:hypothetical protein
MRLSTSWQRHWKVPWGTREPMSVSHETLGDREPLLSISDGVEQVPWTNQEPPSFMAGSVSKESFQDYESIRKMLQRMHHAGELVSPSRGLYTTPGHPCLAQHTLDTNTIPPNTPVPTVPMVSSSSNTNAIPPDPPVPTVPTVPTVPNLSTKVTAHLAETLPQVRCLPP